VTDTDVQSDIDLSGLQRPAARVPRPRRGVLSWIVPLAILVVFAVLLASSLRDVLGGAAEVTVVRPVQASGAEAAAAGETLLQVAGWVEPDPYAIEVPALVAGVVRDVLVQESAAVRAGDVLATLVDDDARLPLAEAEAALAGARARADGSGAGVRVAEAELAVQLRLAQAGQEGLRQVDLAQARLDQARAAAAQAEADQELAQAGRDRAALRLERAVVRAPRDGVVLQRLVAPGAVLGGDAGGTAIVTLYDPLALRVRADVPQAELSRLQPGQRCEILADARAGEPYVGELLRLVPRADIQKVTLQAHVRVLAPDGALRPEMLVQVRFLAAAAPAGPGAAPDMVLFPARLLLRSDGEERNAVWVVDSDGRAQSREVRLGARHGDLVEARAGLNLSDKLVDEGRAGLAEGRRLAVRAAER
jgi:RND family efflux transporter MFP subunit